VVPSVSTLTIQAVVQTPVVVQSTLVVVQATTQAPPVVVQATTTVNLNGPFCSTLTAKGPGLPTTAPGNCGTILIVNSSVALKALSITVTFLIAVWVGGVILAAPLF
jgi:hypothetical protein